jgi:putative transposase
MSCPYCQSIATTERLDQTVLAYRRFRCRDCLEQDHRGIKQRYRPTGGLKTFATASRFCRLFDEIRAFLRPQLRRNQPLSLAQRRDIHRVRFANLMGMIAAA